MMSEPRVEEALGPGRLPYGFARRHGVLVAGRDEQGARLVVRSGVPLDALLEVQRHLGVMVHPESVSAEEFDRRLQEEYEQGADGALGMMDDLGEELELSSLAAELPEPEDLLEAEDDAPIIRLINATLAEAIKLNASDIHVESFEHRLSIRLRVDGVLREVLRPGAALGPLIISRIKVMAKLDIAEKRLPQDGRISLRIAGRPVDVRVSTLPAGHGERVVMRLLDKQAGRLNLEHLGMAAEDEARMDKLIHYSHGILLVTGPTGSGKTTTLYAALSRLNNTSRNIMTVEDPIEYYLDGIGQTQVNAKVDMTFARGLRAILRQDPDVVMVGEIRDLETAQIAVQASLTGHLVLSTLHTNSAVGAVTRLRDMGVEPFLLSSSLIGVAAQRLVRVLCGHCRRAYQPDARMCGSLGLNEADPPTLHAPVGCEHCNHSGYRGRTGIYELVEVDDGMRSLIHDGAGEVELEHRARQRHSGIREDGIRRVLSGETSVEELLRVTRGDSDGGV